MTGDEEIKRICFDFVRQVQAAFSAKFELNKPSGTEPIASDRTGFIYWDAVSSSGVFEGRAIVEFYAPSLMEISERQFFEMASAQSRVYAMNALIERPKSLVTARVTLKDGTIASEVKQTSTAGLWKGTVVFSVGCEFAIA